MFSVVVLSSSREMPGWYTMAASIHSYPIDCDAVSVGDSLAKQTGSLMTVAKERADLSEIGWGALGWIHLARDRDQWRALVNTVMKLWHSIKCWEIL
jgi:hypothetical protein